MSKSNHALVNLDATVFHQDANLLPVFLLRFDRPHTRRSYKNDLVQFFGDEHISLSDAQRVTFVHVNAHLESMELDGQRPSTLRRRLAAVRGFFDWLEALELVDKNPANRQLVRRVRAERRKDQVIVFLTGDQAKRLVEAANDSGEAAIRDYTLLQVLLHCLLRRSEAASMDVEHVRPLGHYWIVDLPQTKGGSYEYVKVPAHVAEDIEAMKQHYGITRGPLWRSSSNNGRGRRLSPAAIYEIVRRLARRAGLSDEIGAHTLRHTGCTLAMEAGATLQQVQTHARHKNIETTLVYVHQRDRLKDSAADYIRF